MRDEIAGKLELSADQRAMLGKLLPGAASPFGAPPIEPATEAAVLAVLTDAQRSAWTKLLGEKFEFPESGPRFRGGPGGRGGPFAETRKILATFDANHDGWLNIYERKAARASLQSEPAGGRGPGRGPGGFGGPFGGPGGPFGGPGGRRRGPGGPGGAIEPATPGPHVDETDVTASGSTDLYDAKVLRTIFLRFENEDWEAELEDFHNTDVDVPATMVVDGKSYAGVGVRFRGMSSYMMLPRGAKRSLNLSLDLVDLNQRLFGYKTLNLLNAHEDPTLMHTVLFSRIARNYIPAPKANFVRVVINGESWGLYTSAQQFDKIFVAENFGDALGARWKVSGSPMARGGLEYLGDEVAPYRQHYEIKSEDTDAVWQGFIALCRTLNQTPPDQLEQALAPILDIDGALWFLAVDNALVNGDGYWVRASDYSLYRDSAGKFHVIPHDMNEALQPPIGPGMGGGRGGPPGGFGGPGGGFGGPPPSTSGRPERGSFGFGGRRPLRYDLDPLVGLDDATKPLRSKLLAVPGLRAKYLDHVRTIARDWLDWKQLGPIVEEYAQLIDQQVAADTRKLTSYEDFKKTTSVPDADEPADRHNLFTFAHERASSCSAMTIRRSPPPARAPRSIANGFAAHQRHGGLPCA